MRAHRRRRSLRPLERDGSGTFRGYIEELRNAFDPHSGLLKSWHQVLFACMLYEAFLLPFAATFAIKASLPPSTPAFRAFYAAEVLFCADFYVKLNTGFYEAGNIYRDKRKARAKYLKSLDFILDVIAVIPLSLIVDPPSIAAPVAAAIVPSGAYWPGWMEFHKVLRIWRVPGYFSNLDDVYAKHFRALKLFKVLVTTAFVAHLVACSRFAFGFDSDGNLWLPPATMEKETLGKQYVGALFWGVGLLTGSFEGALPRRNQEFAFTLVVVMLGFALFIYGCSTLFMLSKSESNQSVLAQARINQLRHLLTFHHVPESLQTQAVEYLKRHYTDAESNDREVVKLLCPSITKDIQVELLKDMVGRIPLFRGCNQQFIVALTSLLEMTSFPAHVTLFEAGDPGDNMYVVNSGVLHILVNGVKVRELRQGSFFGEVSVFSRRPRSAAVVTTSYCTLYRLSRFHTERVLEGYPQCAAKISAAIDEMVNEREAKLAGEQETRDGGEEFMLTTLYQLTTHTPVINQRRSLRERAKNVAKVSLSRSKSTKVLSASRHEEYDGGNISMNENRAINFKPGPIILPPKVVPKTEKKTLVRSQSAYARRISAGVNLWPQRSSSAKSSNRVDTMQGFYDNLARRRASHQQAGDVVSRVLSYLLMPHVIDLNSSWRKYWLIALQANLAANWYIIPLLLAFPALGYSGNSGIVTAIYAVLDIMLVADVYLNLHLSYSANRKKVVHVALTAKHYLRSSFIVDVLCLLPYGLLIPSRATLLLTNHPALTRIPRLLRVWRLKGHSREWESSFRLSNAGRLAVTGIVYLLLVNLTACAYFGLTYVEGFGDSGDTWLPSNELQLHRHVDPADGKSYYLCGPSNTSCTDDQVRAVARVQYARAFYFATTMLTTFGKTVEPSSGLQYSVMVFFMLGGFLLMAVMVDSAQTQFTASAFEQKEFLVTRSRVQQFINSRTAPPGVHQRVKSFLEFWWSSHRGAIASELLSELPEAIKRPIIRSMCQPALQTLSLLAGVRPSLDTLEQVFIDNVRFILYGQGEIIYRQGDYASGLFFLLEGELIIIANGGMPRTLVKGGFIGTAALNLIETSVSYAERVTAASGCILIFVSRDNLNGMHKAFPTFSMAIRALEKRLEGAKLARAQHDYGSPRERSSYSGRERSSSGGGIPLPTPQKPTLEMKLLQYVGLDDIVFDPDSSGSAIWELWMFGLTILLYLKVVSDVANGVDRGDVVRSEVIAVLFDVFFALDLYFRSRLGYYEYGNQTMELMKIRKRFFRDGRCLCDTLALIPLYVVNWMLPFARRREILSINKLLRLIRTPHTFAKLESKHLNRTLRLRMLRVIIVSLVVAHLFGCIWLSFPPPASPSVDGGDAWMPPAKLNASGPGTRYAALLFWSFGLMTSSYAGELPKTAAQCSFTVVVLLSGAVLFAYVVGNLSDMVELVDADSREFNAKLSSLRLLLNHFHLPHAIEEQLKTYFFFQRYHTITKEYLLERCLPPSLLTEIRLVHLQPMIVKVGFLAGMEGSVTRMLVSQFVQVLTVKDQFVFHLGEEGSDMFFVFTGIVEVLVPLETLQRRQSNEVKIGSLGSPSRSSFRTFFHPLDPSKLQAKGQLKKVNELTSGSYFGEVALFTSKTRSAHARSKTSCVLYKLARRSLDLVFERYPEWKKKVLKIVNIQQEQQLLRNLYMEEQMDITENISKAVLNHVDLLDQTAHSSHGNKSARSSTGSFSERIASGTSLGRIANSRAVSFPVLKSTGSFFSSYKAQRSASAEMAAKLQMKTKKKDEIWIDRLLKCTDAQSTFHLQWLKVIAASTICMALAVPYRNAFDSLERLGPMPVTERVVELTCEVLFGWDIWVNWNLKDGLESMELYETKHRDAYQSKRLWIDVLAAIPIDHFLSDFYRSPLLNLNRCLKLINFPHYMKEINRRSVAYEKNRLCTLWVLLFVLMHWCACIYFALVTSTKDPDAVSRVWDSWNPPHNMLDVSWSDPSLDLLMLRFLRGMYFSFTAFIKRGKVFIPEDSDDYLFTLVVDFIGLVTMAFMISEMANLYVSYISNEVEFRKNHIAVDLYLERWHITGQLRARSHAFLSSLWSSHRGVNYQTIFDEVPQVIHTESILHIASSPLKAFINGVFRPFATPHPHDRDLDALSRAIAQHLRYEGYPRDECVVVEGSVCKEMYFVVKGHLIATSADQPQGATQPEASQHYARGDFFGEHGLLGYSVGVSTVKTVCACDLMSLSSEALLHVILSRPLFQAALSIAVEAYRELCKHTRPSRVAPTTDDMAAPEKDWGVVLLEILNDRRKLWLEEAAAFAAAPNEEQTNEPWTASCFKPGQEVGLVTTSTPSACTKLFENLLRLIVTRGVIDTQHMHRGSVQFQETQPVMTADFTTARSSNMSVTEKSDSSSNKHVSPKLPYL